MQLVILAAGKGTRIRNLTSNNKCLLSVQGKPLLYYNINFSEDIEANKTIVVVGYKKEHIISYLKKNFPTRHFTISVQEEQNGIAGALRACKEEISDDFLLCLGDEYLSNPQISQMYSFWKQKTCDILCGVIPDKSSSDIQQTYSLKLEGELVTQVKEKPSQPFNNLLGTGYCMFSHKLLNYLEEVPLDPIRNQYELCDWVQIAINKGHICKVYPVGTEAFNINSEYEYKILESYKI